MQGVSPRCAWSSSLAILRRGSEDVLHIGAEEARQGAESVAENLPLGVSVRRLAQHERSTRGCTVRAVGVADVANDLRPVS